MEWAKQALEEPERGTELQAKQGATYCSHFDRSATAVMLLTCRGDARDPSPDSVEYRRRRPIVAVYLRDDRSDNVRVTPLPQASQRRGQRLRNDTKPTKSRLVVAGSGTTT